MNSLKELIASLYTPCAKSVCPLVNSARCASDGISESCACGAARTTNEHPATSTIIASTIIAAFGQARPCRLVVAVRHGERCSCLGILILIQDLQSGSV